MRSAAILLLACLVPASLAGQNRDERAGRARRLSFVLELGRSLGGPAAGLAAQLRRAGFDDTRPGDCYIVCASTIDYPTQAGPAGAIDLTARLAIGGTLAIGAGYGRSDLGGSIGYRRNASSAFPYGDYVFSHWDETMAWAAVLWQPRPTLRLGGGPGWYQLENSEGRKVSRIGLMAESGVELPADRRLFVNLAMRLHLVPAMYLEHRVEYGSETVSLRPSWSHATLVAGLGVRL